MYEWHDFSTKRLFAGPIMQASLTPGTYGPTQWRWLTSYSSGQMRRGLLEAERVPA